MSERQDESDTMSRTFLDLKRDMASFIEKFSKWLSLEGLVPTIIESIYAIQINALQKQLEECVIYTPLSPYQYS